MKKVYIAGPYSKGDREFNVRQALIFAEHLTQLGFIPYVPHLSHFWDLQHPHDHKFWLDYDRHWLEVCACLLRIPGESAGADQEMKWALDMGKPVFLDIESLVEWRDNGVTTPADG
jgi:hypothetical protein